MSNSNKTQLGKILLKQKLVNPGELEALLDDQKNDHERLASKALEKGVVGEVKLLKALSEQHGVPATNLDEIEINLKILEVIPQDIALKHMVLPIESTSDSISLAMASPDDRRVVDEIEFVSGKRVFPHVALHSQITAVIDKCYAAHEAGETSYRGAMFGQPTSARAMGGSEGNTATLIPDPPDDDLDVEIPIDEIVEMDDVTPSLSEPPSHVTSLSESKEPPKTSRIRILVVDDEDDIRMLITRILTDKGYEVITASRGLEAIKKVQTDSPDMLILDAMLPELHGFDICKKIKGSTKYGHIPVIMISAIYRGWRYAKDLKDSYGVDDFIEKPFKIGELLEKVEQHSKMSNAESSTRDEALSLEAERALAEGIGAYRAGNIDDAIELLKKGVNIDPLAAKLHYHLALLLGKKGLGYQAIRSLENALELSPHDFPSLKNLAVLYQKAGFKFKAIETWERAIGQCPDEETREEIKRHLVSLL